MGIDNRRISMGMDGMGSEASRGVLTTMIKETCISYFVSILVLCVGNGVYVMDGWNEYTLLLLFVI